MFSAPHLLAGVHLLGVLPASSRTCLHSRSGEVSSGGAGCLPGPCLRGFLSEPRHRRAFQFTSMFLLLGYFLSIVKRGEFRFSSDAQGWKRWLPPSGSQVWALFPAGWFLHIVLKNILRVFSVSEKRFCFVFLWRASCYRKAMASTPGKRGPRPLWVCDPQSPLCRLCSLRTRETCCIPQLPVLESHFLKIFVHWVFL